MPAAAATPLATVTPVLGNELLGASLGVPTVVGGSVGGGAVGFAVFVSKTLMFSPDLTVATAVLPPSRSSMVSPAPNWGDTPFDALNGWELNFLKSNFLKSNRVSHVQFFQSTHWRSIGLDS
ncbi:hypothetical protein J2S70_001103 [Trueperella bonasi]|uniref:Uncharacterized protein n=1 Tax=Trueperella bonasi TaxID=312286 RepID=A0ABT9NGK9_9ACTO|nr:hypothetical protein [Trueperella bonasi]MDP9806521.1 hypothetical protein [Trueperella bonasi]